MARHFVILGKKHGSPTMEVVSGPEVPVNEQLGKFKQMVIARENPTWGYIEFAETDTDRRCFLLKPESKPKSPKKKQHEEAPQ